MKKLLIGVLTLSVLLITGCTFRDAPKSTGKLVDLAYDVKSFQAIDVESAFDVVVTQGDYRVTIQVDEAYKDDVLVEVRGDVLNIRLRNGLRWSNMFNTFLKVSIRMPKLRGVEAFGACHVEVQPGMVYDDRVYVNLSGASSATGYIAAERIDFDLSGASNFEGEIAADELWASVSGASGLEIEGTTQTADVDTSGASHFSSDQFLAKALNADASGASTISLSVDNEVRVEASGASSIRLMGSPKVTFQDIDMTSSLDFN